MIEIMIFFLYDKKVWCYICTNIYIYIHSRGYSSFHIGQNPQRVYTVKFQLRDKGFK